MQYILTEEEYKTILEDREKLKSHYRAEIQELCTMIANKVPVKVYWSDTPKPWGCVLTNDDGEVWYCDNCPALKFCPSTDKLFSK